MAPRYIGLAGLGFLGRGIATCLLDHGFHVIALEPNPGSLPQSDNFTLATSTRELANCELVIESITESLPAKLALFDDLEQHVGPRIPITSNTSSIPITVLQSGRKQPHRFAGMHWTSPPYATRFLEIIRGDQTDDATLQQIFTLALELDKEPGIVQKDLPGFVANRIAYAMYREAIHLLEEGVGDVQTIDSLFQHCIGLWAPLCGPFRWIDITGGPALYAKAMERIVPTLSNETDVPQTMRQMQAENFRGTQNGKGFYTYEPGDDASWQAKLHAHALKVFETSKGEQ